MTIYLLFGFWSLFNIKIQWVKDLGIFPGTTTDACPLCGHENEDEVDDDINRETAAEFDNRKGILCYYFFMRVKQIIWSV